MPPHQRHGQKKHPSVDYEVRILEQRELAPVWPIVYLDALTVKVREDGLVGRKTIYLALGVNMDGKKEVLGLWVAALLMSSRSV